MSHVSEEGTISIFRVEEYFDCGDEGIMIR
jgi:hypothetical protein